MCSICWWLRHNHHWTEENAITSVHCIHDENFEQCGCGYRMERCTHGVWINICQQGCFSLYQNITKGKDFNKRVIPSREFYLQK